METPQSFDYVYGQTQPGQEVESVITSTPPPINQNKPKVINWIAVMFFLQSILFFISGFAVLGALLYIGQASAGATGLQYDFIKLAPYTLALPGFGFIWSLIYLWTGFIVRHGSKKAWKIGLWVIIITTLVSILLSLMFYLQIRHLYNLTSQ